MTSLFLLPLHLPALLQHLLPSSSSKVMPRPLLPPPHFLWNIYSSIKKAQLMHIIFTYFSVSYTVWLNSELLPPVLLLPTSIISLLRLPLTQFFHLISQSAPATNGKRLTCLLFLPNLFPHFFLSQINCFLLLHCFLLPYLPKCSFYTNGFRIFPVFSTMIHIATLATSTMSTHSIPADL